MYSHLRSLIKTSKIHNFRVNWNRTQNRILLLLLLPLVKPVLAAALGLHYFVILPWSRLNSRMSIAIEALWIGRFRIFLTGAAGLFVADREIRNADYACLLLVEAEDCKLARKIVSYTVVHITCIRMHLRVYNGSFIESSLSALVISARILYTCSAWFPAALTAVTVISRKRIISLRVKAKQKILTLLLWPVVGPSDLYGYLEEIQSFTLYNDKRLMTFLTIYDVNWSVKYISEKYRIL